MSAPSPIDAHLRVATSRDVARLHSRSTAVGLSADSRTADTSAIYPYRIHLYGTPRSTVTLADLTEGLDCEEQT